MSNPGKRKVVGDEEDDDALRARMRAEGWHFSSDENRKTVPATEQVIEAPAEEVGEELMKAVCQNGALALPKIVSALESDDRVEVQQKAVQATAMLAETQGGRTACLAQGVGALVKVAMTKYSASVDLQADGCAALSNIAVGDGAKAMVEAGATNAIVAAMKAQQSSAKVQIKGCLALGNIAFCNEGEADAIEQGGIEVILTALGSHPGSSTLAEEAADALANLICGKAGKDVFHAAEGKRVLIAAREKHPGCASLVELLESV